MSEQENTGQGVEVEVILDQEPTPDGEPTTTETTPGGILSTPDPKPTTIYVEPPEDPLAMPRLRLEILKVSDGNLDHAQTAFDWVMGKG